MQFHRIEDPSVGDTLLFRNKDTTVQHPDLGVQKCNRLRAVDKHVDLPESATKVPLVPQVLAVDYGTVRLGMAVSDPDGRYAMPLEVLELPARARAAAVAERATERDIQVIVVGRPVRSAGEDSALWPEISEFGRSLERRGFTVHFEDEAFSTSSAESLQSRPGRKNRGGRGHIDALAAKLILEQYLSRTGAG